MRRSILVGLSLTLLGVPGISSAIPVTLTAHNTRSVSGTLSTWKWATCSPVATTTPCLSTTNAWTLANAVGSNAVWDWNPVTGILAMTGTFQTSQFTTSSANGFPVLSDKVTNLVIDTTNRTTTAGSYRCVEGTFLAALGINGCQNVDLGQSDPALNSSIDYNVGGDARCLVRTLAGDDLAFGNARGLTTRAAGGGCDATDGVFHLFTVVTDTRPGGQLILSNGIPTSAPGTAYLTFSVVPIPAGAWLFAGGLGLLGAVGRRRG